MHFLLVVDVSERRIATILIAQTRNSWQYDYRIYYI
jgi:hypothetical protein